MVKIYIRKTSDWNFGYIHEYENLEACVNELIAQEFCHDAFGHNISQELVISKPDDFTSKKATDCDYVVEIYDTWRE